MSTKSKKSRKGLAIGLAILGIAGLSLATASQLTLTNSGKFQSGAVDILADCQGTVPITVGFTAPALNATTGVFSAASITFAGVKSQVGECVGLNYKVAIKVGTTYTDVTVGTPKVAAPVSPATTTTITVAIPSGTVQSDIAGV